MTHFVAAFLIHVYISSLCSLVFVPLILVCVSLCFAGEVFDYLVAHGRMKEKEARAKFRQVPRLLALQCSGFTPLLSAVLPCFSVYTLAETTKPASLSPCKIIECFMTGGQAQTQTHKAPIANKHEFGESVPVK